MPLFVNSEMFQNIFSPQEDTIIDTYWLVGSSLLDSRLDIFNDSKPKKRDGVLQRRMKQREMEVAPRRRPYDSSGAVPNKRCAFRLGQIPVATSKTEEVGAEETGTDGDCEAGGVEEVQNVLEEFMSLDSTTFTAKDCDDSKLAESFTVKVGGEGGLAAEGSEDWQAHQTTGHGVSEENLVPVS